MICPQVKTALTLAARFAPFFIATFGAWLTNTCSRLVPCRRYLVPPALVVALVASFAAAASTCRAITLGHIDNFNDGTRQGWGVGAPGDFPVNEPDIGQSGTGDHALWMATEGAGGTVPNLLVFNTSTNWRGNWTMAGVSRIELDVRDPGANNFPLAIRLGIARGLVGTGGSGDTYVTQAMEVPKDGQWHRLAFDVSPSSFSPIGGTNIDAALANVSHFRILHNPLQSFSGATTIGGGEFYLDNIQALSATEPPDTTGDYNGNNVVDAADYVVWREMLGQAVAMNGDGADGNRNGTVDPDDYNVWRMNFGRVFAGAASGAGQVAAVPEPTTCGLIAWILALGYRPRKRFLD